MTTHLTFFARAAACTAALLLAQSTLRAQDAPSASVLASLKAPDGWIVERVAASPVIEYPMMAGFDDRGRLYVAEAAGVNLNRKQLEQQLPNSILRLEDVDGDGVFDKQTVFADKLTYPMGALWHRGALYACCSGALWKFVDTNDDGVADVREPLVEGFGFNGNGCDLHGPFLSPTGRLVWCEGRHGHEIKDRDGKLISKGQAARIFTSKLDGSDLRVHCGGGMDNPVDVDFTPEGEMLGDVNLFYRQRGDCFVHWMHGGVYPRDDQPQCLAEFRRTGDLLPEVADLGHVALSGLCRTRTIERSGTESDPHEWFITEFNSHKVTRLTAHRVGATFAAKTQEFLTSSHPDFHPTDVLEDADGSLIVVDTGGWFLNGCPTSQVAKPEARGGLYRVRRADARPPADPRGLRIALDRADLKGWAALLDDPRFVVRERAVDALALMGPKATAELGKIVRFSDSERARRNAVWALSRIDGDEARANRLAGVGDASPSVRLAAIHAVVSETVVDPLAIEPLVKQLEDQGDLPAVREAAVGLGRARAELDPLLLALNRATDRAAEHALIYALIEHGDATGKLAGYVAPGNRRLARGALIALEQLAPEHVKSELIVPLLADKDAELRARAFDVLLHHPEWGEQIEDLLRRKFAQATLTELDRRFILGATVASASRPGVQSLLADAAGASSATVERRLVAVEAMGRTRLPKPPESWSTALGTALRPGDKADDGSLVRAAINAAAALGVASIDDALLTVAHDSTADEDLRAAALAVVASHHRELASGDFELLKRRLGEEVAPTDRLAAARALAAAKLSDAQRAAVVGAVATAGPLEASHLVACFEGDEPLSAGLAPLLVAALERSPGLESISIKRIEALAQRSSPEVRTRFAALMQRLDRGQAEARERLDRLAQAISGGDVERGKAVFFGKRAACSSCHRVGGRGAEIGPDLTTIGERRTERDLLEAVLYPSLSLARGFETYSIETTAGKTHTGVVTSETASSLTLRLVDQTDVELLRDEVAEMTPNPLSVMPAGLEATMNPEELRALIAYLKSLK